ncbi:MAG: ABC transporter permease [Phycisphaerales bacterium JB052]
MSFRQRITQLDQVQRSRTFKVVASVVIAIVAIVLIGYGLMSTDTAIPMMNDRIAEMPSVVEDMAGEEIPNPEIARAIQIQRLVQQAELGTIIAVSSALSAVVLILVVWLNLGLIYPLLAGGAIGILLLSKWLGFDLTGSILFGMITLTLIFMVLMRGAGMLLNYAHPVLAIARNVLAEAVRMKISLVFIVMLFFVLAALPMLLNDNESLRYRVQSFLQYSTGFTYLFVGLLVVFFGAATVTYEQREKVIWQTMTKPVAAWQYLLGKWLGVSMVAAILLGVSALGVFQFTEYMRRLPAKGEISAFVPLDGTDITEDRLVLETRVLTSRVAVPSVPDVTNETIQGIIDDGMRQYIEEQQRTNPDFQPDSAERAAIEGRIYTEWRTQYYSIDPNAEQYETFVFQGLGEARELNLPLTLRYKINAEGNRPDMFYILTFAFADGTVLPPRRTGLGFSHYMTISPDFIDENGQMRLQIYNGQLRAESDGIFGLQTNVNTFTIPPDGLELSYSVGGYRSNFARVYFVLWVKLSLLGMLAVWASTFSSFPVACLISGGLFFIGESAGFVQDALPGWGKTTVTGDPSLYRTLIYHFADTVSSMFKSFNELRPATRLSEGELLSWSTVSGGVMTLGVVSLVFFGLAVAIFRKRQLAIYSGN